MELPHYSVREASLSDLDALTTIQDNRDLHERRLRPGGRSYHPDNRVFLVEKAGEAVGYVHAVFVRPPGTPGAGNPSGLPFLQSFLVKEGHRNQGAGSYLFAAVTRVIQARGYPSVYIVVDLDNPRALRLYERLGFVRLPIDFPPEAIDDDPVICLVKHFDSEDSVEIAES